MNKKDAEVTIMEFDRIKYYPLIGRILLLLGIVIGFFLLFKDYPLSWVAASMILGLIGYLFLAFRFRCPDCGVYLWFQKNGSALKKCPHCQAQLRKK